MKCFSSQNIDFKEHDVWLTAYLYGAANCVKYVFLTTPQDTALNVVVKYIQIGSAYYTRQTSEGAHSPDSF